MRLQAGSEMLVRTTGRFTSPDWDHLATSMVQECQPAAELPEGVIRSVEWVR
jgi:hypothetical protein